MSAVVPAAGAAACKWQSGSSRGAARGLPYLTGLLILNDLDTGLPLAVMDSTWLTAERTAAATAAAAKRLAPPDPRTLAVLGCGVQGRAHVRALGVPFPRLDRVRAYDVVPANAAGYADEMRARHGVDVAVCGDAETAVAGADIVVSGGPIEPHAPRALGLDRVRRGALVVAIDYDCYWEPKSLQAADGFYADDAAQMAHLRGHGYFLQAPPLTAEIGEVIAGSKPGRRRADETIVCMNMGVAVEDVTCARRIYDAALRQGRGTRLPV
jgi:ornithine cyclodeaminase/alanine dehydrogenase